MLLSASRFLVSLARSVAALSSVAVKFSTYGRFVYTQAFSNFSMIMTHFQQRINLVSLCLSKLMVCSHTVPVLCRCKRSFDFADQEALMLPQLTSFSALKVALVS
jgi:hypothetical protein